MDSGSEKDGESSDASGISSVASLHDHSDLLIPNPSFIASPASVSSTASSNMMITSPCASEQHDLHIKQMDCQISSPQESLQSSEGDFAVPLQQQPDSSPPNVVVDDSPLQPCMGRNKESLKVKLLMRRPMNQLVEQGILPPPKTPAAFAGQRVRLERARMGDLLKAKIQQRPARQELIRQHILEDTDSRVAPSLAEKQRMLKRARLADSLSDHLIHRPGPLELVQKNILHAPDENIDKAIKEGIVSFKATCEGHVPGPSLPNKYTCNEDDSSSDISSPAGTPDASSSGHTTEANTPLTKELSDSAISSLPLPVASSCSHSIVSSIAPSVAVNVSDPCEIKLQPAKTNKSETASAEPPAQTKLILATPATISPTPLAHKKITPATIFQVTTAPPASVIPPPPPLPPPQTIVLSDGAVRELLPQLQSAGFQLATAVQKPQSNSSSSFGKSRSSKKSSKSKSQPKARTIKFHEYKGPSSCVQKGSSGGNTPSSSTNSAQSSAESSYELLLKQQQLFLQWQLEWQHKYPQILLPAAPKVTPGSGQSTNSASSTGTISIGSNKTTMSSFPVTTINLLNQQLPLSSQQVSSNSSNANPKSVSASVTLAPKVPTEIAPKPAEPSGTDALKTSETAPSSPEKSSTPFRSISLNNINEWKVNDLKAELKKRSLPVSGSKMQLVERLKAAAAKDNGNIDKKSTATAVVKMEVAGTLDESSSEAMMEDENGTTNKNSPAPATPSTPTPAAVVIGAPTTSVENNNFSILDMNGRPIPLQNILSLFGVSTLNTSDGGTILLNKNNSSSDNNVGSISNIVQVPPSTNASVISQLPISTVVATAAKVAAANSGTGTSPASKLMDENNILELQKQILELHKQLEISKQEQQKSQQKDLNNGGQQKHHRLVLQHHIQQKQRQQAIQNQLQSLMQLQNQQAEQKKQQKELLQQQAQAQLVLVNKTASSEGIQTASVANGMLPMTLVNSQPSTPEHQVNNNQWIRDESEKEEGKSDGLDFEDLVKTIDAKDIPKLDPHPESVGLKKSVKSQMVDDVLEILIRNGELPPSAAQDPHHKTPSPSSSTPGHGSNETVQPPPPPPPLPPPTFSVMLPTTIPFSRHQQTSTSGFLSVGGLGPRTEENLSKEAQEILRISEDLSNFGKTREAEAAAAAAAVANRKLDNSSNGGTGSTSMDCGFFTDNKDYDLSVSGTNTAADSMEVGFTDSHSVPLRNYNSNSKPVVNQFHNSSPFDSGFSFGQPHHNASLKSASDGHDHHQSHFMSDDELLPVSLDMQMDTDYSDWLDTLLPENCGNSGQSQNTNNGPSTSPSSNLFHHSQQQHHHTEADTKGSSGKISLFNHNNNNSHHSGNSGSLFGLILHSHQQDQDQHSLTSRDPLLSSTRGFCTSARMNSVPFGEPIQQQNNFLFAHPHHHNNSHNHQNLFFGNPTSIVSTSSNATLMDTDFDELTAAACNNLLASKKSENNICASSSNNLITEMPSTTTHPTTNQTPITTSSINDNFLWDFAM